MTFCISIGRWGGIYFHRDYTTRLCFGWVAFTFFPCDLDNLFSQQRDTVEQLVDIIDDLSRTKGCYMTTQQDDDILASVAHRLRQRATDAQNWQAQAEQWKATADRQRTELDALRADVAAVCIDRDGALDRWREVCTECATLRQQLAEAQEAAGIARVEIEQVRGILEAMEDETLVQAANDLVQEERTTREASDNIHRRYWEELMPLARALDTSIKGDGNGRCWCGAREADALRSYLERAGAREGA